MTESNDDVGNNARSDDIADSTNITSVDDSNGVCTDISARDEFVPWEHRRASEARANAENIGNDIGKLFLELRRLRDKIDKLTVGQQNLSAAGKTVDDIYVRVIDMEKHVENIQEPDNNKLRDMIDDAVKEVDIRTIVDDVVYDKDLVDKQDLKDEVLDALRNNVTLTVQVEEN